MSVRLPRRAREVLDAGTLCYVAVRSPTGPHLTPVVYVLDGGRLWLTTSRSSTKARSWRTDRSAAGLISADGLAVSFRGTVRTYDALDPLSWPSAAVAGPRLLTAATRFSLKNARFFAGYAVDARRVPFAWTPPGRVFVSIEPTWGTVIESATGTILDRWGERGGESKQVASASRFAPRRGGLWPDGPVPETVRAVLGDRGAGVLAVDGGNGTTVLPGRFHRMADEGGFDVALAERVLSLAEPAAEMPAALVIDRASRWRAAEMRGALIRGQASVATLDGVRRGRDLLRERLAAAEADPEIPSALLRVRPRSLVWWDGWSSGTVLVARRAAGERR